MNPAMIASVVSHKGVSEVFQRTFSSLKKGMQNSMAFTTYSNEILFGVVAIISINMMNVNFRGLSASFTNFKFIFQTNIKGSESFTVSVSSVFSLGFVETFFRAILPMSTRAIPEVTSTSVARIKETLSSRLSSSRRVIALSTAKFFNARRFLRKYFPTISALCLFISSKKPFQIFLPTLHTAIFRTISILVGRFNRFINFIAPLTVFVYSNLLRFMDTGFGAIFRVFTRDSLKLSSTLITNKNFHLTLRS